jgi:ubiquinone/menaquinone biosynthesis C-methylase UbiE
LRFSRFDVRDVRSTARGGATEWLWRAPVTCYTPSPMIREPSELGRLSPWRDTADIDETRARELANRLELRARAEDEAGAREEYLRLLDVSPGERVLDVGCGSGVVMREVARRVSPDGVAVGLDPSLSFLTIARELAEQAGLASVIELCRGDCRALPFPDCSFDAVLAATVLAHVPNAEKAIVEMIRVTRVGGRVGVFDFDADSVLISHPDRALTRRIVVAAADHASVNGWLIRQLPGLFADLGLENVRARAFMPLERTPGSFYARFAERAGEVAAAVGAITGDEHARWLDALRAEEDAGRFLGGRLHVFVWGIRRRGQ